MSPAEISAAQDKQWNIPRVSEAPKIDGRLDEDLWEKAALRVEIPYEVWPSDNDSAGVRTEAYLAYTKTHLYAAFKAYEPNPKSIRARLTDRDTAWNDDNVGLIVDTFNNQREAYYFNVNPLGIQMDRQGRGFGDSSWNGVWESRGRLYDWGYAVEMEIPFSTLRFQPGDDEQTWGFDVQRTWPRDDRRTMSSVPRNRDIDCILCQYPKLSGLRGLDSGRNLEFVPTLVGGRADAAGDDGELVSGGEEVDVGGTVRWGMTPSLTLSATANPDFSQVEADVAQLEINRAFTINFPEARPFFLEGADSFRTPLRAVQTRSIVQPSWGLKLTGQQGRNGLGVFVAEDEVTTLLVPGRQSSSTTTLDGGNTSAVLSYNRNMGQRSRLGVLATQREGSGYENSVAGAHGFFALSQTDSLRAQVLFSDTLYPETESLEPADLSDHALRLSYRHESNTWEWGADVRDVGDDFRADLGFMPRVGFRQFEGSLRRQWRQNAGALWSQQSVEARRNRLEDADGIALNDSASLGYSVSGKWQSRISFGAYFGDSFWNGSVFDGDGHWLELESRPAGSFQWGLSSNWGDSVDFTHTRQAESLRVSPRVELDFGRRLRLRVNHTLQQLDVQGGELFEANLSQLRMVYQFNARTFVRAIVQYRDLARNAALYDSAVDPLTERLFNQLLFSYKLNPATVFFLGYSDDRLGGEELDPLGNLQFNDLQQTSRTLFLKLGYRWLM
ncbi:MAG: DUF5916 domain-containing protein [Acidobacteriota bacterium]